MTAKQPKTKAELIKALKAAERKIAKLTRERQRELDKFEASQSVNVALQRALKEAEAKLYDHSDGIVGSFPEIPRVYSRMPWESSLPNPYEDNK